MTDSYPDVEKIIYELSKDNLNSVEINSILGNPKNYPIELIEKLSLDTALKYWNGKLSYEEGDCVMNNIYSY